MNDDMFIADSGDPVRSTLTLSRFISDGCPASASVSPSVVCASESSSSLLSSTGDKI